MMRQLVDRGCGKPVSRVEAADKSWREQHCAIVMNGRITQVRCDGIPAILRVNALEVLRYFVKSLVPSELLPTIKSAANGILEPVFIVVKVLQGNGLGADVAAAEGIVFVPANVQPFSSFGFRVSS